MALKLAYTSYTELVVTSDGPPVVFGLNARNFKKIDHDENLSGLSTVTLLTSCWNVSSTDSKIILFATIFVYQYLSA